jgi:prepilin-type N-terminal cleavage/methylation domain-containing protein
MNYDNRIGTPNSTPGHQLGFTLLEFVVVVAILGILVKIAAPTFSEIVATYNLKQLRNAMYKSANIARAQAINRGTCVAICKTQPTTAVGSMSCVANTDTTGNLSNWASGWMVFEYPACSTVEKNTTATADKIIYLQPAFPNQYQLIRATGTDGFMYNPSGVAYNGLGSFLIQKNNAAIPYELICISWLGKLTSKKGNVCA